MNVLHRIQLHRSARDRGVFIAPALPVEPPDGLGEEGVTPDVRRARLGRLARRRPYSPVGGTVLRPFGDAMTAIQALRAR